MAKRTVPLLHVQAGRILDPVTGPFPSLDAGVAAARKLFQKHESLYVIDLDGVYNGVANLDVYQALEKRQVFPWIDAGARTPEHGMDALMAGADALTLQLRHLSPEGMEEVGAMSESDLYVGFTVDAHGVEKGLRPSDILELVSRVGATGVVFYEGENADLVKGEEASFDIQRAGVPVAWVARANSPNDRRARTSLRFSIHVGPEALPP